MTTTVEPIARVARAFSRLPGIGPKSAQRLAYHLLNSSDADIEELADSLRALKGSVVICSSCFNVTDSSPCSICTDPQRDRSFLCVVERPSDIAPIERTGKYHGRYHVLHGALSPSKGIGPDDLRIRELLPRLRSEEVSELILATNPTVEGEATAMYIRQMVAQVGVSVTKLARGLPYGADLEYADDMTLGQAIELRQGF
jgi:recombination protein RecR